MHKFVKLMAIVATLLFLMPFTWAKEIVNVYTYHNKPPYYFTRSSDNNSVFEGIYPDFINYLNSQQNEIQLILTFIPRIRLENDLKEDRLEGGIIGVNPVWFNDKEMSTYLWSAPMMIDQDVVIVQKGHVFPYSHPRDIEGRSMSLSRGLYYWGVSERISANKIQVTKTNSEVQNLNLLSHGRVDATIMSRLTAEYYFLKNKSADQFDVLEHPHDQFYRQLLFPKAFWPQFTKLKQHFDNALSASSWTTNLSKWQQQ